jgi:hypothetical protein
MYCIFTMMSMFFRPALFIGAGPIEAGEDKEWAEQDKAGHGI